MISDRELFMQMLERDIFNIYNSLAKNNSILGLSSVQDKIMSYSGIGIEYLTALLFGNDLGTSIDEAAEMAELMAKDQINNYRDRIKRQKEKQD